MIDLSILGYESMGKSEIAILMAAGMGTRMRPLTETTPKPLITVHGKPMIETVIDGLKVRGVDNFLVVVGYLGEQFKYLEEKYRNLRIVENHEYQTINNISSLKAVADMLVGVSCDCFICEADLYVRDINLFNVELNHSCYFGKMVSGHSDDWVFDLNELGRITRVGKVGDDCFNMIGVAWFKKEDASLLGQLIKDAYRKRGYENMFWDDVVNQNLDKLDLTVHEISGDEITEIDTVKELSEVDESYIDRKNKVENNLEDILKTNQELKIQEYLEKHLLILKVAIGVPDWAFNYILPQFRLGSRYRADFIVVTGQSNSYEVTIVELKRPGASLYTKQGIRSNDLNIACVEVDNYRRWIGDNTEEFKKNLFEEIKKKDPTFVEKFNWTRRFHICSKIVIGRRDKLTSEICDKNFDMENIGVSIISYDRLIDAEKKLSEMFEKNVGLELYRYDDRVRDKCGVDYKNMPLSYEDIGTDNILFLGDEEREYGQYGFYEDIVNRKEK